MAKYLVEVVGIYYRNIIEAQAGANIRQILDAANGNDGFSYEPNGNNKVAVISHEVPAGGFGPTRGGATRPPGTYRLAEVSNSDYAIAWQYYIERPISGMDIDAYRAAIAAGEVKEAQRLRKNVAFQRVSFTRAGQGFKGIDSSEQCEDGDVIVWRCVWVFKQPGDSSSSIPIA